MGPVIKIFDYSLRLPTVTLLDVLGKIARVRYIDSIIGAQWGQKNPNLRAHRSSGKRGFPSFPLNVGPDGWDFSVPTIHQ